MQLLARETETRGRLAIWATEADDREHLPEMSIGVVREGCTWEWWVAAAALHEDKDDSSLLSSSYTTRILRIFLPAKSRHGDFCFTLRLKFRVALAVV
jgi:hypothetical protein